MNLYNISSIVLAGALLCLCSNAIAQQTTNPVNNIPTTIPSSTPVNSYPGLANFSSAIKKNYIRTILPDQRSDVWPPPSGSQYNRQTTQYFDGLGRALQTVMKRATGASYDLVQTHIYDAAGREAYQFLPFSVPEAVSTGDLCYQQKTRFTEFYSGTPNEEPYSLTQFENSPLNREIKSLAPGRSWVGSNRGSTTAYLTNTVSDDVKIWRISSSSGQPSTSASYGAGQLTVTLSTDEDGKKVYEYKDKKGLTILRKAQLADNPSSAYVGFASTYYVYDNLDRLVYVIPPQAVDIIRSLNWDVSSVQNLCFSNTYNNKGLLLSKKVPGKGLVNYFYDAKNRPVLFQDANLAGQGKWMFTIFDALDRAVVTGLFTTNLTTTDFSTQIAASSNPSATSIFYFLKNYNLWHTYPSSIDNCYILSYNYYDNYVDGGMNTVFTYDGSQLPNPGITNFVDYPYQSKNTNGLQTGSKVRVIDPENTTTDKWLASVQYYDEKGRLGQMQSQNIAGGIDKNSYLHYFRGMTREHFIDHNNPLALAQPGATDILHQVKIETFYEDKIGDGGSDLTWHVNKQINSGPYIDFGYYYYDHLSRVTNKLCPAFNELNEYDMNGHLNHINVENSNNTADSIHLFEENVYYDKGFTSQLYNGNIAGVTWRKAGVNAPVESYGYSYDNLNRLNHAEYRQQPITGGSWDKSVFDYSASNITYDLNGNLQSMKQMVPTIGSPTTMDDLTYHYAANSNQLSSVSDAIPYSTPSLAGLPDFKDKNQSNDDYSYDANGNLITDKNKLITGITYNFLDKPETITVQGEGSIVYVYDANGNRLQKRIKNAQGVVTEAYDYMGDFVYKNNVLQYINNEEGRARPVVNSVSTTGFVYDFFVKDHLGNVRTTVTADPTSEQYMARHEVASANIEQLVFDNIPNVRGAKPGSTDINDKMAARLNGSDPNTRVGTAIMLKTMPGDRFTINVDAFYEGDYEQDQEASPDDVVSSLMGALMGGTNYDGVPLTELPENVKTVQTILSNPNLAQQIDQLININNNPLAPKAHLNYLFFDDRMNFISTASGAVQVPANIPGWSNIHPEIYCSACTFFPNGPVVISPGNGYVIVYIDNQSIGKDVWFDNLAIGHYSGSVLEENHYYPYGLCLNIDQNLNLTPNTKKYQSIELEKHFGIETYETFYRGLDPQIGRFNSVDPKAEKRYSLSPFVSMSNNPVTNVDPLGNTDYTASSVVAGNWKEFKPKEDAMVLDEQVIMPEKSNDLNVVQAAGQDIGKNDYNRQRADWASQMTLGTLAVGSAPFAAVAAFEAAPALIPIVANAIALKGEVNVVSGLSDFAAQMHMSGGDIRKWNIASTAGATFTGNPFYASLPGGVFNVSWNSVVEGQDPVYNSITSAQTWKSILLNTAGNVIGDKSEGLFMKNLNTMGASNIGTKFFTKILAQQAGDVPSAIVDDATK